MQTMTATLRFCRHRPVSPGDSSGDGSTVLEMRQSCTAQRQKVPRTLKQMDQKEITAEKQGIKAREDASKNNIKESIV